MAYNLGPEGATLNPAITLTATYDPQGLPQGVAEDDLYIAYWDGSQWLTLETTVNTEADTASCQLSHFTVFAVIGTVAAPAPPAPAPAPAPTPAAPGVNWPLVVGIIAVVIVAALLTFFMVRRRAH